LSTSAIGATSTVDSRGPERGSCGDDLSHAHDAVTLLGKEETSSSPPRSPVLAALLSALWCGLGHLYAGRYLTGLLLAALYLVSLLSTVLFYGYVTTPLLWLAGIVSAAYVARRPLPATARRRGMRISIALLAVIAVGTGARALWLRGERASVRPVTSRMSLSTEEPGVLSKAAAGQLRYLLDVALRPVDDWGDWSSVDQFGQTALRYQIAFVGYALAQTQYLKLPAYAGPIRAALDNLIQRMLDKRVWGYWRFENLWGNWDANPDPAARDNVMYSGHLANLIGLYEVLFGDHKYDEAGAIQFRWSQDKVFSYDHLSLVRRLYQQMNGSPVHAIACEPHQIFLMCNDHAALAFLLADRVHGTHFASVLPSFVVSAQKIFSAGGLHFRYPYYEDLGVTLPLTLSLGDAWALAFSHPFAPAWAERMYPSFVRRFVRWRKDGGASVRGTLFEFMDIGNYRPSSLSPTAFGLVLSREMADQPLADALQRTIDEKGAPAFEGTKRRFRNASLLLNAVITLGMVNEANGLRRLYQSAAKRRPSKQLRLERVTGDVDVTEAHFDRQKRTLRFRLSPVERDAEATISIAGAEAGRRLQVAVASAAASGATAALELQADSLGKVEWTEAIAHEQRFLVRTVEL